MRKIFFVLFLVISTHLLYSQILEPVDWSTDVKKISDSEYELIINAEIEPGWHLYSQNISENGPVPTTFTFKSNAAYAKKGNTKEEEGKILDDPVFKMKIKFFENKATFTQRIKILKPIKKIDAEVEFMVCDDSQCLPPTLVDLEFNLN
ncbi:MAG: cytochrome C biogenesis protein [Flavobacteriales bacterium]|nr:MAG: cytochrome C biogenesis protein [Flavobacteriales bacterium]